MIYTESQIPESLMQSENHNKVGVVIITYNNADLLDKQIACFSKFCKDNYEMVIIDNSTNHEAIEAIAYKCSINNLKLIKTDASSKGGSDSHAFAANVAYMKLHSEFDYLFYVDHDCFPIMEFSVVGILKEKGAAMAGLGQEKKGVTYFWPGCVMWNENWIRSLVSPISFSPGNGLDTGGGLSAVMSELGDENLLFFNERHVQNPEYNKSFYNFFSLINDGMFMHFVNGSNWNAEKDHQERINSLYNILEGFLKT